jgi:hypothetical protein
MPGTVLHAFTNAIPDGTNSSVVRPSDWNSGHLMTLAPSGAEVHPVFSNDNGISFNLNTAGKIVAAIAFSTLPFASDSHTHGYVAGTNISATSQSNGLSLSVAAQSLQPLAVSAGNGSALVNTLPFANSNGVSFSTGTQGVHASVKTDYASSNHSHGNPSLALTNLSGTTASNSAGLTISLSAAAGGGGADGYNVLAAGSQTATTAGTVKFENSNGISFGMSGSTQITASHNGLTTAAQSNHSHGVTVAATNLNVTTGGNSNGINLSLSAIVPAQTAQPVAYSAANGSANFSTLTFANSNGVSFSSGTQGLYATVKTDYLTTARASNDGIGLNTALTANGVSMTANSSGLSLNFPAFLTTAAQSNHSHGNPTLALTNISGTTASNSAGLTLSLSAGVGGGGGAAFSAGTQSVSTGTVNFANSNGITFGMSGSNQITASHNGLTTAAQSNHSHGNPTLALTNLSGTTASNSAGLTLSLSAAAAGGGGGVAVANSQTTFTSGTANFVGSNITIQSSAGGQSLVFSAPAMSSLSATGGVSVSANGSTLSIGVPLQTISAANGSYTSDAHVFANSNGISFSTGTQGVYASHNGLTTAAQSNHSHGNPTLALTNLSGTTASASNGLTISLSAAAAGGGGGAALSAGTQSVSTGTVAFANSNGVTFGMSGSNQITASHNGLTTAALSNHSHAFSASGGSSVFQTINFANSNGITFSNSNGSVIASHNGLTTARVSNDAIGLNSGLTANGVSMTANSSGLSLNFPAFLTTAAQSGHSHGNPTLALTNLSGTTASASNGLTISLSANSPGAAAENNWFALGGNTAGNSTASGSTIQLIGGNNITLSGLNNSQIQIVGAAGGGGGVTLSGYDPFGPGAEMVAGQQGNGVFFVQPLDLPAGVQFNHFAMPVNFSGATNSSGSFTVSFWVGLYSKNGGTLSYIAEAGGNVAVTMSGTVGSYSNHAGMRRLTIPWTSTIPAGNYWIGIGSRTTTGGAAGMTMSQWLASQPNSNVSGIFGVASAASLGIVSGQGSVTTGTTATWPPTTIAFSHIAATGSMNLRPPLFSFASS